MAKNLQLVEVAKLLGLELEEEFDPILQKLKKSEENKKESRFINLTDF